MYSDELHFFLSGELFELFYFFKPFFSITFITAAAAVVPLIKVSQHVLYKSFAGFIVQSSHYLWAITVSWDRSSAESEVTNQLLLKEGRKLIGIAGDLWAWSQPVRARFRSA